MTLERTQTEPQSPKANTLRSGMRRWLGRATAAGAMALALLGGGRIADAQGLTPGGPIDFGSQPVNGTQTSLTLNFSASVATTIQSVNALTLGVANRDFTVISQTCTGALAPPQSCTVNIGFIASTPGLRRGALTVVDSTGTVVNQVFLHGIGVGPQLVTSPAYATTLSTLPGITPSSFEASALAIDGAGTLYFNDLQFSRVLKMTTAGNVSVVASLVSTANSSLAIDGSGTLYLTSGAVVYRIPSSGVPAVFPTGNITMSAPRGVAVDGTGYVYIADANLNEILRVAPDGTSSVLAISGLSTPLSRPSGLTIDAANILHIADTGNARVVNVGIYTSTSTVKALTVTSPTGVAVDASNSVVVTDPALLQLVVQPSDLPSNAYQLRFGGATLSNPAGVAVKDNGDVVLADPVNGLTTLARNASQVNFPTTTYVGHLDSTDGVESYHVQNSGNVALQFVTPTGTATNAAIDNTAFAVSAGNTNCPQITSSSTGTSQLVQGAQCAYGLNFTPSIVGTNTGHAVTTLTTTTTGGPTFAPITTLTGNGQANTAALQVTATPSVTQPGSLVSITITAQTAGGTTDAFYTGTVTLTATDAAATFPGGASSYTFTAADAGTHTFTAPAGVIFNTLGTFTVKATDGTFTGTSNGVLVEKASGFTITATPATIGPGQSVGYTVSAMFNGAVVTNYTGTVTFSATDPAAAFLGASSYTFTPADHGTHTFTTAQGVQFNTVGVFTIGATDGTATGTSNNITVIGADAFTVSVSPTTTTIGTVNTVTVTARYQGAVATSFTGAITLSSSDATATFPQGATYTFTAADHGVHTFTPSAAGVVFHQGGDFTVTASAGTVAGTSNVVHVVAITSFNVVALSNTSVVGQDLGYTVTAMNGTSVAADFTGTVTFTSTDSTSTFPGGNTYTFTAADGGSHTFAAPSSGILFNQEGTFTITATSGATTGTSQPILVYAANSLKISLSPTTTLVGSPVSITVQALSGTNSATGYRETVTFTSSDPAASFLSGTSYTFTAADNGTHTFLAPAGVSFGTLGTQTVTVTDGRLSATSNGVIVTTPATSGAANGFTVVATPSSTTIGTPVSYTVTATIGGVASTAYTGTVNFTSTDTSANFLSGTSYTFTAADNGSHTFTAPASGIKFNRAGMFTITATDGTASGTSNGVTVSAPSTATGFTLTASPSMTGIGGAVSLTVSAVNSSGAIQTGYTGMVTFSSSDPLAKFLGGTTYTFTAADAGTHTFSTANGVQFNTAGTQTASATDGTISGTSNAVTVVAADSFVITATPSTTTADSPVSFTITAMLNGAVATNFVGTVTLSSTDGLAKFLGGTTYTFSQSDAGVHTFSGPSAIKFESVGVFTITATAGTISGTSNNVTVLAPASFAITVTPSSTTAGAPVSYTVTATSGGTVNKSYVGTVTFTSTDSTAKFLSGTTYTFTALDQGTHTFSAPSTGVTFNQGGTFTVSATDGTLNGTSNNVTVLAATGFVVTATPTTTSIGKTVTFTVTAVNGSTVIPNYTGTITLSSTDSSATFLGGTTYTFTAADQGTHTFTAPIAGVAFNQAGTFTVTATSGALTGTSNNVIVNASGTGFTITATPTSTTVGSPVSYTITANSGSGVNTAYTGTVAFTSTDATAKFLSGTTYTFTAADQGSHTFTVANGVQFNQGGTFTISATDGTLSGTSNAVTVLAPTGFAIVATPASTTIGSTVSYTITAVNVGSGGTTVVPNYTGTVTFSSTDSTAKFLSGVTYTFTAADKGSHTFAAPASGVQFNQAGTFTIAATDGSTNGTSNSVVVNPVATGFTITATPTTTSIGTPVSFTISATNGGTVVTNYTGTVTFTTTDTTGHFLSGTTYTFSAADKGAHTFTAPASGVQFNQAGSFTVSATDGAIRGTSNVVVVNPKATGFVIVATPATTTVGAPVSYTISAVNNGTVITGYTGTVTITSTDTGAAFPGGTSYTFTAADSGAHTFAAPASGVKFSKTGTFTVSATDGTISGTSNNVVVNPAITGFSIVATPSTTTVGVPVSFTITALNGASTATAYMGTVNFAATDATAKFLSGTSYTFTAADAGTHTFTVSNGVQFNTAGTFTISAMDGAITGTSNNVVVNPLATAFTIAVTPSTTTVGTAVSYTITAVSGTAASTGYTGTVTLTSTDTTARFLSGTTVTFTAADSGTKTFTAPASGVQFNQAGTFTISATDGRITGTSNNVIVNRVATGFTITATPSTTNVGTPVSYTITAANSGTVVSTYTGTVTLNSTDTTAKFLSGTTLTFTAANNGTMTFTAPGSGVQFNAPGTFTISATDGTITGTSNNVVVIGPNAFTITASPSTTTIGVPVGFTVAATYNGTVVTNYTGTVTLSATDPLAKFLSGSTFTFTAAEQGVHVVTAPNGVSFGTIGTFTINAISGTVAGTSNSVIVDSVATVLLTTSVNPILTGATTTLTATVPAAGGFTPGGQVTFMDGTTSIGTATLNASGTATLLNVSFATLGTHSLTAVYAGDAHFAGATSAALLEVVEDFSLTIASGSSNSMTVLGGHTGTYQLQLTPLGGSTFAAPITFTATGIPSGTTVSFTPATLSAGGAAATVAFSVTPPVKVGGLAKQKDMQLADFAPWTGVLVMLGLGAFGSRRKRITRLLMLAIAILPLTAMTGCLSSASDGYYGAAPTSYTITITAISGSLTHTTQVTLSTQ